MGALFKFISSFYSPRNYTEMLRKLAFFLFWEVWIATFILRDIPVIEGIFLALEQFGPTKALTSLLPSIAKLNISGFILAFVTATIAYASQLHDQISNIFGIRKSFDQKSILLPLAELVGIKIDEDFKRALISNRHSILRQVFYPYVSSRAKKTLVDKHDIERALDGWSWYWVLIEAMPLVIVCAVAAALAQSYDHAVAFCIAFLLLFLAAWLYSRKLPRLARPEIESIANDAKARKDVIKAFRAL
jgi:hypothetical protein